jgi:hypothetical protein
LCAAGRGARLGQGGFEGFMRQAPTFRPKPTLTKLLFMSISACLVTGTLRAAPPECKMVERNGITFTACQRSQADSCMSYVKEHHDELGAEWMGCWMPAFIDTAWPHGDSGLRNIHECNRQLPRFRDDGHHRHLSSAVLWEAKLV